MDVKTAIENRRAYRSLEPVEITEELIDDLAYCAQLAPSCFNNQPCRFVFVYAPDKLKELHTALSEGNEWAQAGSMIIAVFGKKEEDCIIHDREYYLFDIGLAVAHVILRATELGLVAHPIAGFSPKKVKEILQIPPEAMNITLIIVGKHSRRIGPLLTEKQRTAEPVRPERKPLSKIAFKNVYKEP